MRADLPLVVGRNTAPVPDSAPRPNLSGEDEIRLVLIGDLANPRKGADVALEALRLVRNHRPRLMVVGGGKLLPRLAHEAESHANVRFLGPLRPPDVAAILADADALLFPTRSDIFGLALVEAMGARLAPIVSRAAGAVDDLAVNGHNALVVDDHDPATWARAIEHLAGDRELLRTLADRAHGTIQARWTVRHSAHAMIAGLRLAVTIAEPETRT